MSQKYSKNTSYVTLFHPRSKGAACNFFLQIIHFLLRFAINFLRICGYSSGFAVENPQTSVCLDWLSAQPKIATASTMARVWSLDLCIFCPIPFARNPGCLWWNKGDIPFTKWCRKSNNWEDRRLYFFASSGSGTPTSSGGEVSIGARHGVLRKSLDQVLLPAQVFVISQHIREQSVYCLVRKMMVTLMFVVYTQPSCLPLPASWGIVVNSCRYISPCNCICALNFDIWSLVLFWCLSLSVSVFVFVNVCVTVSVLELNMCHIHTYIYLNVHICIYTYMYIYMWYSFGVSLRSLTATRISGNTGQIQYSHYTSQ